MRCCLLFAVAGCLLLVTCGGRAAAESRAEAIQAEFQRAGRNPARRQQLIEEAAKIDIAAVDALLVLVHHELAAPLAEYRRQFTQAATPAARTLHAADRATEIKELRGKILALVADEKLTAKQIMEVADPALARLKSLAWPDPRKVFQEHPELRTARERLLLLGKQWQQCAVQIMLAEEDRKTEQCSVLHSCEETKDELLELKLPSFADYLAKEEELAAALTMQLSEPARQTLAVNAGLAAKIDAEAARCLRDLNLTRLLLGLPALQLDLALCTAAREHSADMQRLAFFSHESPVEDRKQPWDRAKRHGTTAESENIAVGTVDGAIVNDMWWHSPGHFQNLLGDYTRIGIGRHGKHWTELFGR